MDLEPIRLIDLLDRAAHDDVPSGWLYLPSDWRLWAADTSADMVVDNDDIDEREGQFAATGYWSTIDADMIESLGLKYFDSFAGRLEALTYYVRFDAFLPYPGAPDPPSAEELRTMADRRFYDGLGEERVTEPCRRGCGRGAVRFSVFCRPHHFEDVTKRASPFSH